MQMRSGLRDPPVIPVAHIKWEHDTVFLGVQTRRKCDGLCCEDRVEGGVKTKQCSALAMCKLH